MCQVLGVRFFVYRATGAARLFQGFRASAVQYRFRRIRSVHRECAPRCLG
jgi:hypothetical protein